MATVPKGSEATTPLPTGGETKLATPPGVQVTSKLPPLPNTAKPPQFVPTPSSWNVDLKSLVDYVTSIKNEKGIVEANKVIAWLNSKRK